jgi:hypothetical protein
MTRRKGCHRRLADVDHVKASALDRVVVGTRRTGDAGCTAGAGPAGLGSEDAADVVRSEASGVNESACWSIAAGLGVPGDAVRCDLPGESVAVGDGVVAGPFSVRSAGRVDRP